MNLGIAVVNYNRLGGTMACLESIRRFTSTPHRLILADDGSPDGSAAWARSRGYEVVGRSNRGVAWNYNRALYTLRDCDFIMLLENDMWPVAEGWELPWIQAAETWGHVNYAYECAEPAGGAGTGEDPWRCEQFGSQVVVTSQAAFKKVGYQDPRFYQWKYSNAHAEWTFRFEKALGWNRITPNTNAPCLRHGVKPMDLGSIYNPEGLRACDELLCRIVNEPPCRLPWLFPTQQIAFVGDLESEPKIELNPVLELGAEPSADPVPAATSNA
jgi:glycosyltransferase involved in cell wall biosynthesis